MKKLKKSNNKRNPLVPRCLTGFKTGYSHHREVDLPKDREVALAFETALSKENLKFVFQDRKDCFHYHIYWKGT